MWRSMIKTSLYIQGGATFSMMVGGPKNHYSFELFLEIRGENEVFKPYNSGGWL